MSPASSVDRAESDDPGRDDLPDPIHVTNHATTRWRQRTTGDPVAPRVAWFEATPLNVDDPAGESDELRYHAPTSTVLIRVSDRITTVVSAHDARPAILSAVAALRGDQA